MSRNLAAFTCPSWNNTCASYQLLRFKLLHFNGQERRHCFKFGKCILLQHVITESGRLLFLKELRRAGLLDVAEAESAIVELRLYGRA